MKVIFLEDVAGAADAGEVKDVKNGFARNFLLPRGLAAPATPGQLQRIRAIEAAAKQKRLQYSEEWGQVAALIQGMEVPVEVRVGPNGRLFGSVTGRHIADRLSAATGRAIDHRQVLLGAAIHEPGDYPVNIRLYREVTAEITVSVVPEGYEAAQAAEAVSEDDAPASEESTWEEYEGEDQSPDDDYDEDEDEPGDGITGEEEEP